MAHRILLSGGGTGGHLYPALNLAAALQRAEPDVDLMLVGARRGVEARVLPSSGWPYRLLPMEPLYRTKAWRNWRVLASAPAVFGGLSRAFSDLQPQLIVGTGGYASGPAVAWGVARGLATAIQEQNAMPGLATRALASHVDQIHLGNPEARKRIRPGRGTAVFELGNPVAVGPPAQQFDWPEGRIVLAFGGSQGARALNDLLLAGLGHVEVWPEDVTVVWVAGPANQELVAGRVLEASRVERIRVVPYIEDLGGQLDRVTLAISRAGAMTCAELAAAGVPSIYVPLPTSAGDHQRFNARAMVEAGAGLLREEGAVSGHEIWHDVLDLLADVPRLGEMAAASRRRGRPDAADRIAAELLRLAARESEAADD
ncbi:MAG: UDP-N-acetylglucosamine--N-acetylmuramyl-(pentapeptide) pyrophosphoryl-undecaprenol N-acetylglucosamine transferase [Candidatus Palauibacterales bacterium]|nr:UDP-N-acetylglucosamine--N-acetylmuramyl-(pentapeptide) pyrophosphoryl-undecaprenol N-acetylglucosamine transferase [Candidatus Palauibacterales bacterium]